MTLRPRGSSNRRQGDVVTQVLPFHQEVLSGYDRLVTATTTHATFERAGLFLLYGQRTLLPHQRFIPRPREDPITYASWLANTVQNGFGVAFHSGSSQRPKLASDTSTVFRIMHRTTGKARG
ncbi:hypothetical protein KCP74_20700 [Salmonella enterica subsp. enterica]|nr:hypothetical protein KCP74_20700 [Salmonella enterica subsp. enterica]